jgi:hypothetical protein
MLTLFFIINGNAKHQDDIIVNFFTLNGICLDLNLNLTL